VSAPRGSATAAAVAARAAAVAACAVALAACAVALAACGLAIQEPDLFVITRTGPGPKLTMLVNYSGTVTCNGRKGKLLPDRLIILARDVQPNIHYDADHHLRIPRAAGAVYMYRVTTDSGTITFPDTAAARHPSLGQLELFTAQAAQSSCGIS
jgi:hypothetical protein